MRLMIFACLALVVGPQSTTPAQLSMKDRDAAVTYLTDTRQKFLASIEGLSAAQWQFKAAPDRWSIAEVAEHIAISETTILQLVTDKFVKSPLSAASPVSDQKVIDAITDRSAKFQAPEMLKPTSRWSSREALTKDFLVAREKSMDYVKSTPDDLRGHGGPHPVLKTIDAYQWVLLLAAHSARHTAQIDEVKTSAGYPK